MSIYHTVPSQAEKQGQSSHFSPVFHFNQLKIGNLENASAINFGNNYPNNFKGYKKQSQGLGNIDGDHNDIHDLEAYINQQYLFDAILDREEDFPDWIRKLIKDQFQSQDLSEKNDKEGSRTELYSQLKSLMEIERVPFFFHKLNEKENLLEKVTKLIFHQWDSSNEFNQFYNKFLQQLNNLPCVTTNYSGPILNSDLCLELADHIEEEAKVLLIVIFLIEKFLPGYLNKYKKDRVVILKEKLPQDISKEFSSQKIISLIKESLRLKGIPLQFKKIKNSPEVIEYLFFNLFVPLVHSYHVEQYFYNIKDLFFTVSKDIKDQASSQYLTAEEKSFLFTLLLNILEQHPKILLLEFITLSLCKNEDF